LASERLPRKVLREILGHPMIAWVYQRARECASLERLLVATDAEEIARCCRQYAIPVMMTSPANRSGTDRVVEVMGREPANIYVNIQGDEPMVTGRHIDLLLRPFAETAETQVSTLKVAITTEEARNPNHVKVVTNTHGSALYFSRAVIPCDRDGAGHACYYKHLGFYAYTAAALRKFCTLAPSPLETAERLEQLGFLENGVPVVVVETPDDTVGVDTEEDLARVEAYFRRIEASPPRRA
jgi:3-deoxy-manno-octulosonate cytidylyltransferase (CMP-KDO synthetase)